MSSFLDTRYPVLMLKADTGVIHHGSLAVARTLGRQRVPVYAIVGDSYAPLAKSRYLTKAFVWKHWPSSRDAFLDAVSGIGKFIGHPAIIVALDDLSAVSVAENAPTLARWFLLPPVPPELPRCLANTPELLALCTEVGLPCARSIVPRSLSDVEAFARNSAFPVIVKASEQWQLLNDRFSTKLIQTPAELYQLYGHRNAVQIGRTILQEYIVGDDWVSHGYYSHSKNVALTFTGRKLRAYPMGAGSTALGVSLDNAQLRRQTDEFLKRIGYSGIIDIDWRRDERDGEYKIVDCNPRVGQNFRMFENSAEVDVIRALHLDLSGRAIDYAPMIEGRVFTVEPFYMLTLLQRARNSQSPDVRPYLRSGRRVVAWWAGDDQLPFFVMGIRILIRALRRALAELWPRSHRTLSAAQEVANNLISLKRQFGVHFKG